MFITIQSILKSSVSSVVILMLALPTIAQTKLGYLNAKDPRSRINIRSGPSISSRPQHYGLPGDSVDVIRNTRSSDGYEWYFVKFHQSGATGWVREDLIMIDPGHGCHFRVEWGGGGFNCN